MSHPAVAVVERALAQRQTAEQIVQRLIEAGHIQGVAARHMHDFDEQRDEQIRRVMKGLAA